MIIARIALTIVCLASVLTLAVGTPYTISLAVVCLVFIAALASL